MRDLLARCLVILNLCCGTGGVLGWWWYAQEIGHDCITSELVVPAEVSRQICVDWNLPIEEGTVNTDLPVSVAERAMQWIVDHRSEVNVVDLPDAITVATACQLEILPGELHHTWRLKWTAANPEVDIAAAIVRSLCNRIAPPQEPKRARQSPRRDDLYVEIEELEREEQALLAANPAANAAGLSQSASEEMVRHWSLAVATARQRRAEAENRYTQVKADVAAGVSLDVIAARLPSGPMQAALLASIERNKLQTELTQRLATRKRLAEVFGRRHPQLAALDEQIATLHQKIADTGVGEDDSPTETLSQALASELSELQGTERDLQDQLDNEQSQLATTLDAQRAVTSVRQRLAAKRAEFDRAELFRIANNGAQPVGAESLEDGSASASSTGSVIQLASASTSLPNSATDMDAAAASGVTHAGFSEGQTTDHHVAGLSGANDVSEADLVEADSATESVDLTFSPLVTQTPSLQRSEYSTRAIASSGMGAGVGAVLAFAWLTLQRRRKLSTKPVAAINAIAAGSTTNASTQLNVRPVDRAGDRTLRASADATARSPGSRSADRTMSRSGSIGENRGTGMPTTSATATDPRLIKPQITGPSIAAIDALRAANTSSGMSGKNSTATGSALPGTGQPLSAAAADEIRRRLQAFGRES